MPAESALCDGSPAGFELIETLRWEPNAGFHRLDRHLARLAASATALGFVFSQSAIEKRLRALDGDHPMLRVRLALRRDGTFDLRTQPFDPLPAMAVWRLGIARTRLESSDGMIRHKTTLRGIYDRARAEFPIEAADEVILLNERGEICEGTITTIFVRGVDGMLSTPPLACGLLPGVLRQELLDRGEAREAVLHMADLHAASAILVGNSLRGLIRATLS